MATYGTKFRFRWQAANGAYYEIDIKEKGYSGTVYDRAMGSAPQLKRENNGHIYGTSLDIYAECQVDGEFSSLYTSDPTMYLVELLKGPFDDQMLVWTGFVSPELYSEPDIAPPYDVTIVATDCLGELKLHDWAPAAQSQTILAHLNYLMSFSGLDLAWNAISAAHTEETTAVTLLTSASVDMSYMDGKTCYESLEGLLSALNMCITQHNAQWLLWRTTDLAVDSHTWVVGDRLTRGGKIAYRLDRIGSARDYEFWPVGQLSSEIEPAAKSVTVKAPNYYKESAIKVEDFVKNDYAAWLPVSETRDRACWELGGFRAYVDPSSGASYEANLDKATRGVVSQSTSFAQATPGLRLALEIGSDEMMAGSGLTCRAKVYYTLDGTDYYLQVYKSASDGESNSWVASESSIWATVGGAEEISTTEFYLPPMPAGATLAIVVEGSVLPSKTSSYVQYTAYLYGAYLTYASEFAGQQLKVNLSNNAREDLSEIESIFSTWSGAGNPDVLKFRNGIVSLDGSPVTNWQSDKLGAQDYLGFITMDCALESALPRLVKTGKIFISASGDDDSLPIGFYDGNYDYIIDTFTLDLLESEMDVRMTSLPAAALTVESQVRTALPEGGGASSRGSSGSSGGGGGGGGTVTSVGLTMPAGFTVKDSPVTGTGTLNVSLDSDRVLPTTTQTGKWDDASDKAHVHDNKGVIDDITAEQIAAWDKVATGKTISSSVVEYGVSYSGTEKPTYWMSYVPEVGEGFYLWTRVTTTYTDGTKLVSYSVSRKGKDGKSFSSEVIEYGVSYSASSKPSSWSESVPTSFTQGSYLWTRTTVTYSDGTTSVSYSVSYISVDGAGVSSTVVEYAVGSSGTSAPSSGWSTSVPSVAQGKYLWTRMTMSYTDGRADKVSYSVSYQGTDGSSSPGLPGCIYRTTKWEPNKEYRNDEADGTTASDGLRYIDVCTDTAMSLLSGSFSMYICKTLHTSGSIALGNTTYWRSVTSSTPIASTFLLSKQITADLIDVNSLTADEAFIAQLNTLALRSREILTENLNSGGYLQMAGNLLQMFNGSGNERLRVHGGTLSDLSASTYKDPSSAKWASASKTFTASSSASYTSTTSIASRYLSSAMVLTLPAQSVSISASAGFETSRKDSYDFQVCVEWLVDDVVKNSVYGALSVDYDTQTASGTITLPATVLNMSLGSHTVKIRTTITNMSGVSIGSNDDVQVSSSTQVTANAVTWATSIQKTEIANNGFRVALASNVYFTVNLSGSTSTIQMMNGSYGLKLTSSGLYKTTNGGSTWTSL